MSCECLSFLSFSYDKFHWDVTSPNFVGRYQIFGGKHCFYFQAIRQSSRFHYTYYRFQKLRFWIVLQLLQFRHVTFKTVPRTITTWLLCEPVTQEEHYFRHACCQESWYRDGFLNIAVSLTKYWHFIQVMKFCDLPYVINQVIFRTYLLLKHICCAENDNVECSQPHTQDECC